MRVIEFDIMELSDLKYMAKKEAVFNLKASMNKYFSAEVQAIFRRDFHRSMELFKKANIALNQNYVENHAIRG